MIPASAAAAEAPAKPEARQKAPKKPQKAAAAPQQTAVTKLRAGEQQHVQHQSMLLCHAQQLRSQSDWLQITQCRFAAGTGCSPHACLVLGQLVR